MAHSERFDCGDVDKRLKGFLDDMLSEEEYAAFTAHLRECRRCRDHVAAIGSISNDVRALSDALDVPADFGSTVLFKMRHPGNGARAGSRRRVFIVSGLVFAAMAAAAAYAVLRKPVTRQDGRIAGEQTARAVVPGPAEPEEPFFTDDRGGVVPVAEAPVKPAAAVAEPFALHWHLTVSDDAEKRLFSVIEALGMSVEYRSPQLVIVNGAGRDIKRLRLALDAGGSLRMFSREAVSADEARGRVSIAMEQPAAGDAVKKGAALVSLESRGSVAHVHWHVLLILPKKEELFSVIRNAGGLVEFESGAEALFSLPSAEVENLRGKVKEMDGVILKLSAGDAGQSGGSGRVMLSLHLQEE